MPYAVQSRRPGTKAWMDYPNPTPRDRAMSVDWADLKAHESRVFGQPEVWRVVRKGFFTDRLIEVVWEQPLRV